MRGHNGGNLTKELRFAAPNFYGIGPNLSLVYASSAGRDAAGLGWRLAGWPSVARVHSPNGGEPIGGTEFYELEGSVLLPCAKKTQPTPSCTAGGTHFAREEDYRRYKLMDLTWEVTSPAGVVSVYRRQSDANEFNLESVTDAFGNRVNYIRTCADGDCLLGGVEYGESPTTVRQELKLYWEDRPDPYSTTTASGVRSHTKRLKSVAVSYRVGSGSTQLMSAYQLGYSPERPFSLISMATFGRQAQVASDGTVSGASLPLTTMAYGEAALGFVSSVTKVPLGAQGGSYDVQQDDFPSVTAEVPTQGSGWSLGDINGDSRADWIKFDSGESLVRWADRSSGTWVAKSMPISPARIFDSSIAIDFNADGLTDGLTLKDRGYRVFINDGQSLTEMQSGTLYDSSPRQNIGSPGFDEANFPTIADLDGDGRPELIGVEQRVGSVDVLNLVRFSSAGVPSRTRVSIGPARGDVLAEDPARSDALNVVSPGAWLGADLNGDGTTELIRLSLTYPISNTGLASDLVIRLDAFRVDPSAGTFSIIGSLNSNAAPGAAAFEVPLSDRVQVGDFDGDGRDNIVLIGTKNFSPLPGGIDPEIQLEMIRLNAGSGVLEATSSNATSIAGPQLPVNGGGPSTTAYFGGSAAVISVNRSLNNYNTTVNTPRIYSETSAYWMVSDLNGDGADDLALLAAPREWPGFTDTLTRAHLIAHLSDRQGGFVPELIETPWFLGCSKGGLACRSNDENVVSPSVSDLNGDGRGDVTIVVFPRFGQQTSINDHVFRDFIDRKEAWSTQRTYTPDIDGDGKNDLVMARRGVSAGAPCLELQSEYHYNELTEDYDDLIRACVPLTDPLEEALQLEWAEFGGAASLAPDGRADILIRPRLGAGVTSREVQVLRSLGNGQWASTTAALSFASFASGRLRGTDNLNVLDYDADGFADIVVSSVELTRAEFLLFRSLGNGSFAAPERLDLLMPEAQAAFVSINWQAEDVNGDGRAELVGVARGDADWTLFVTWLDHGSEHVTVSHLAGAEGKLAIGDYSGDGKADVLSMRRLGTGIQVLPTILTLSLGLGTGNWASREDVLNTATLAFNDALVAPSFPLLRAPFVSGASISALFLSSQKGLTGSFELKVLGALLEGDFTQHFTSTLDTVSFATEVYRVFDLNSDRRPELGRVGIDPGSPSGVGLAIARHPFAVAFESTCLKSFDSGMGLSEEFIYRYSAGGHTQTMPLGSNLLLLSSVATRVEPQGRISFLDFEYVSPRWSYADQRFLGYASTSSKTGTSVVREVSVGSPVCPGANSLVAVGDVFGNVVEQTEFQFRQSTPSALPRTCRLVRRMKSSLEYQATPVLVVTDYQSDLFGNILSETEQGRFSDSDRDDVDELPSDNRTVERVFVQNLTKFITDRKAFETTRDGWGTIVHQARYGYDNLAAGLVPTHGSLTTQAVLESVTGGGTRWITANYAYNAYGSLTREEDAGGRERTISYRADNPRLTEKTCTAHICTTQEWDIGRMLLLSETDLNRAVTERHYDQFARLTAVLLPNGGCTFRAYLDWGEPKDQRVREGLCKTAYSPDTLDSQYWVDVHLDGLGRPFKKNRQGMYFKDMTFLGNTQEISTQTDWYKNGGTPRVVTNSFDTVLRVHVTSTSDGAMEEVRRFPLGQVEYDQLGSPTMSEFDGLGRLIASTQWVTTNYGVSEIRTSYEYDPLDHRTRVTDVRGNRTTMTYSLAGRLMAECDPDRGCSRFEWDDSGEPTLTVDAAGNTCHLGYDALGRVYRKDCETATRVKDTSRFYYDADPQTGAVVPYGIGRLVARYQESSDTFESFEYSEVGSIVTEKVCIAGDCVTQARTYNRAGLLDTLTHPNRRGEIDTSSEVLTYTYDSLARPNGLESSLVGKVVRSVKYEANDRILESLFGNYVRSTFTYDPARAWLGTVSHVDSGGNILANFGYLRDTRGVLHHQDIDNGTRLSVDYTHDELARLRSSNDGNRSEDFEYDDIGNMTFRSSLGAFSYDPNRAHVLEQAGGISFITDRSGNVTKRGGVSLEWDAFGHLSDYDGGATNYRYGADGTRVQKNVGGTRARYFGSNIERLITDELMFHYEFRGAPIASRLESSRSLSYLLFDGLDSVAAIVDDTGSVIERVLHDPFGAASSSQATPSTDFGFGGHLVDRESNFVYMGARYYDPIAARFLSADSLVPDVESSQSFNRYAYVNNSPLGSADATGHLPSDYCIGWGPCMFDDSTMAPDLSEEAEELYNAFERNQAQWDLAEEAEEIRELMEETQAIIQELSEFAMMGQAGVGLGVTTSMLPMGSLVVEASIKVIGSENLPQGFELGIAIGNIVSGAVQLVAGLSAMGVGGAGAMASMPLIAAGGAGILTGGVAIGTAAAGAVYVANGAITIATGLTQLYMVARSSGSGNSRNARRPQHVYEIYDKQSGEIMKVGVSGRPLVVVDGKKVSPRAMEQVRKENAALGKDQFAQRLVKSNLGSRLQALQVEWRRVAARLASGKFVGFKELKPSNGKQFHQFPNPKTQSMPQ